MFNGEFAGKGLCGWSGRHGAAELAHGMAEPLARFYGVPIQACNAGVAGLAVAGVNPEQQFFHEQGLLVAVCGLPRFKEARWQDEAVRIGMAAAIAHCWREKGRELCSGLHGEFSLAVLDERTGDALLAVDRMGTRPLYYQDTGSQLLFGSSIEALIRHPLASRDIDSQSIYNYVYFHMVPGPATIYEGQQRLLPGECLVYHRGRAAVHKYWRMQFQEERHASPTELKEQFRSLLLSSVRESLLGGKTGAFLSGGTDSSTIAAMLGRMGEGPARTYSIGFEAKGYDEMAYARIAARHFSTSHHEYYVTPDDVVEAIPKIAAVFDQPFGNASAVPAFYCAQMARRDGIERMLGGDGGDELFGGNERYAKQHIFSLYERIPVPLRAAFVEPIAFMPGAHHIPLVRKARSYIEQAVIPMPARLETYNLLERYGHREMFTADFLQPIDPAQPLDCLNEAYRHSHAKSLINRMLALDLKITLADNDLPKVVKACELAGMDVAFPFLNDDMVAFSARLAPELKLKGTKLRYFFKEALRGVLPDEIISKKKHGFGLPFGVWLQKHRPLHELAADSLNDLAARRIVRRTFIDDLLGKHLKEHAGYHGTMVWVLMMLEQWLKQHGNVTPPASVSA